MIGLRFFFPLKSADVRGAGTRDEPLRTSGWEAIPNLVYIVCRSSNVSPLPDTFPTLFFFTDNFDGDVFL